MKKNAVVLASLLVGCAATSAQPPTVPTGAAAVAAPAPSPPVTVDDLLRRVPEEGSVWIRLSVFREHPLGYRAEPFVLAWLGWDTTIQALSQHPMTELDWIEIVGPKDPAEERLMTRTAIPDDVMDARLAARADGTLRIVVRPRPHLVAGLPPDMAPEILKALAGARVADLPAEPDEALHVDFPNPHDVMPHLPAEVRHALVRVFSRPGSAAEGFADLTCDDEGSAARVADEVRARAERMNSFLVRLMTRDLLSGLAVTTAGCVVSMRIPANADQLSSLATLASGWLPPGGTPRR